MARDFDVTGWLPVSEDELRAAAETQAATSSLRRALFEFEAIRAEGRAAYALRKGDLLRIATDLET